MAKKETKLKLDKLNVEFPLFGGILQREVASVHAVKNLSIDINKGRYYTIGKDADIPLNVNIIDPETCDISTLLDQIHKMIKYANDSLLYFNNTHIIQEVDKIIKDGTEADKQITVFNNSGFKGLRNYLMDNIEYHLN